MIAVAWLKTNEICEIDYGGYGGYGVHYVATMIFSSLFRNSRSLKHFANVLVNLLGVALLGFYPELDF